MPGRSGASTGSVPTSSQTARPTAGAPLPEPAPFAQPAGVTGCVRRHILFLCLVVVGLAWRMVAQLGFLPLRVQALDGWFSHHLTAVVAAQHLLGLVTGLAVYASLLRWGIWRWLSALAAAPALLAGPVIAAEQLVLPDSVFVLLVAAAATVLCWRARVSPTAVLGAGVLCGVAALLRPSALVLLLGGTAFVLLIGSGWRERVARAVVLVVGFSLPVLPYVVWYHHVHSDNALQETHAELGRDLWRFETYTAAGTSLSVPADPIRADFQPAADSLVSWEGTAQVPRPLAWGAAAVGLLGAAGIGRAGASRMRAVCLLWTALPAATLAGAAVGFDASWRNLLPGLVLWPAAGALGLTAMLRGRRGASARRPQHDDVDRAALAEFDDRYATPRLAPVSVVIAAYNEADGLPRVLSGLPQTVCGLSCDVVVVDDGSSDGTATTAMASGSAYVVACGVNRGQGAALRLGYRVARDHGARYLITTDADGQYDTGDFPVVLAPILEGRADFVTGSRRLGRQLTRDRFRRAGVYVFAWTVGLLTGRRLTDTSFGLRAMRAELTDAVTLNQPQYQSSELLIGALSHGFRVAEVPGTMHLRSAGSTKKGGNLVYGSRYARVVLGTWWREGCPSPAPQHAPALAERP